MTDAPDFTGKYNTELSGPEEVQFRIWASSQRTGPGQSALKDLYDYDLRGWWKENGSQEISKEHLTDKFKKPNHPTFSDESQYHGVDGFQGGKWSGSDAEGWAFTPGKTNLDMRGQDDLQDYFSKFEGNSKLMVPE